MAAGSSLASLGLSRIALAGAGNGVEPHHWSATDAVAAMQRGEITAEAYAKVLLTRCDTFKSLNAFISLHPDAVLAAARGADLQRRKGRPLGTLHGLPIAIKDSVNVRGLPTSAGTASLRAFEPAQNSPLVDRLLAHGAYPLGKTNLHELSLGYTTNNATFGPCRNPYDVARSPGGSSGGSAVAVAARLAPLAVAEDTLGSIRVPAAQCGIVGFRPSIDRYPKGGIMPITPRFDTGGAVARSVDDLLLFDRVMQTRAHDERPRALRGIRLGLPAYQWSALDGETERVCRAAVGRLREHGVSLVEIDIPSVAHEAWAVAGAIIAFEVIANETEFLTSAGTGLSFDEFKAKISPGLRKRFDSAFGAGGADAVTPEAYRQRLGQLGDIRHAMAGYFEDNGIDAMVCPTTLTPALAIGVDDETEVGGRSVSVRYAMARNVAVATCAGTPGLALPAGLSAAGLPIGLEFDGSAGGDRDLLRLGRALENALGRLPAPASF